MHFDGQNILSCCRNQFHDILRTNLALHALRDALERLPTVETSPGNTGRSHGSRSDTHELALPIQLFGSRFVFTGVEIHAMWKKLD
jgi:hypothetical protein